MLPALPLGLLTLPTRPVLLLLGLWLGVTLVEREGRQRGTGSGPAVDALWGAAAGYLAGRMGALLPYGLSSPLDLLALIRPLDPALAPLPALLAAAGVIAWRWHRRRIPWRVGLDAMAPLLLVMAVAWALGDWAEGRRYGEPTAIPLLAALGGGSRHPVQLYEAGLGFLAFVVWHPVRKRLQAPGSSFLLALTLYSAARLIAEGFRAESLTWMGFRVPQLLAFAGLMIGLVGLARI
ncbi:MAG: prolipoprotein diacylglyceryl transferase, partial [Thermoflexus sp.]|nr:prolipoprotein diacylglyceryl transferase [Thermoflexus sp.]